MLIQNTLISIGFLLLLYIASQRAHRAVYACTIAWLVYPNWGTNLFGIRHFPLFFFLEMAMTAILWFKILVCPLRKRTVLIRREDSLQKLFWLAVIVQYLIGTWVVNLILPLNNKDAYLTFLPGLLHVIAGLTFFQACMTFIESKEQIIGFLKIYFYFAIVLATELAATLFVSAINTALYSYTIKLGLGNFFSVFLNDFLAVQLVCSAGFLAALYFWFSKRQLRYILGAAFIAFPLLYNIDSRSITLGLIVASGFFLIRRIKKRKLYFAMAGMAFVVILYGVNHAAITNEQGTLLEKLAAGYTDQTHKKEIIRSFNIDSIFARFGIQARGLDLAREVMPFGVGKDMARHYMSLPFKRQWVFGPDTHPEIRINYEMVCSGDKVTEVHSGYLDCLMSFGVLGVVALFTTLWNLWLNLKVSKKISTHRDLGLLRDAIIAIGIVILVKNIFVSNPKIYVIIVVLLHASFLLALNRDTFNSSGLGD